MGNSVLARNVLILAALDVIGAAAAEKKLKFMALKGAALLIEGLWPLGEREMTDLDLLIRPADEKAFDLLLAGTGFKPMENSSQAYYRMEAPSAPPVIVDIHTALWHAKETAALWHRSRVLTGIRPKGGGAGRATTGLGFEDQLLHLASHHLLHHGSLPTRALADLARLLEFVYSKTDRAAFWLKTSEIAEGDGLEPVVYPALRRLSAERPELLTALELSAFEPRGAGRLKRHFFEKAAAGYSRPLEYFLPGLYRPKLFFGYLFPGRGFLERRYGEASLLNRIKRPFSLLLAPFRKGNE